MSKLFKDEGQPHVPGRQKVCLATVVYENPDASYTYSIQKSRLALEAAGIQTAYMMLSENCHSDDARNTVFAHFLMSDCTDIVFLDSDVSWDVEDLIKLCQYDEDFVGGVYPYRRTDVTDRMPVYMIPDITEPDERGLVEVEAIPAGFMRCRRFVVEALADGAQTFFSRNEDNIPILFDRTYKDGTRLGADVHFCMKWTALGGKVYAAYDMWLGHTAKTIQEGSLGSYLRKQVDQTPKYVADTIKNEENFDISVFRELRHYMPNNYAAREDTLALATFMARQADGPILEAGSGLTTICMAAAAPDQVVWCLEHDRMYAAQTAKLAYLAGVTNIAIVHCRLKGDWYEIEDELPDRFALGLNDGPPRFSGGERMGFFDIANCPAEGKSWGDICDTIVCDDAQEKLYLKDLQAWAKDKGRRFDFVPPRAALLRKQQIEEKVA